MRVEIDIHRQTDAHRGVQDFAAEEDVPMAVAWGRLVERGLEAYDADGETRRETATTTGGH
jgi:hypothetical protein